MAARPPAGGINPGPRLARGLRLSAAGLLCCALLVLVLANTAQALNMYQDMFVTLSARSLGMGGACAAVPSPASVFSNPACLAGLRQLTLMWNHSARHFPGSSEGGGSEWDQLDGDTEVVVLPLPLSTFAHGFTFSGEMGYDYSGHPADGRLGYPREHYWGGESYDAWAVHTGLPCAAGIALRQHYSQFTPAPEDANSAAWLRLGEGTQWGVWARVLPGLDYGRSDLKLDYDYIIFPKAGTGQTTPANMPAKLKHRRTGYALHPTAWLTLASDQVDDTYVFHDDAGLGSVHQGTQSARRTYFGAELQIGPWLKLRQGSYDGKPTCGLSLNAGGIWLNYAEAQGLLPSIVGSGDSFKDVHIYGAEVPLW
jgi:hypothetical protein